MRSSQEGSTEATLDTGTFSDAMEATNMAATRKVERTRTTGETDIRLTLDLDGDGRSEASTGVGFFDHMLDAFARHGLFDLAVVVKGDLHVDAHHTVEDTGLVLGAAVREAVGDKASIRRFGSAIVPMDEALVQAVIDLSGRPFLAFRGFDFRVDAVGAFDTCLTEEFFRAFSNEAACNLHLRCLEGGNAHHVIEAAFKATARALREAVSIDPRIKGVLSTKGTLA